jgi:Ca-activated chloride channel family protein
MQLYEPGRLIFIWAIPLFVLLFLWGEGELRRRLSRLGQGDFLRNRLMPGFSPGRRRASWVLLLVVFLFSTLALARPQWGEEKKKIERKGVDLLFILDTSLSMLAEDVKPNRLNKSKLEIKNLIRRLKGDRVGMVAFAGSGFLQCPLTLDYSAFLLFVDGVKVGYIPHPGTSLARAIDLGIRGFSEKNRKYRAMIVFSDGEDHEGGIAQAVANAKKAGVRVYTVGVGTPEGEPIPLRSSDTGKLSGYKKDRDGEVVVTRLNATLLAEVAKETGGLYLPATAAEREVEIILKHLETLGERQIRERLIAEREDHFQLFLFLAFLFLVGETLLGYRMGKPVKMVLPLLAFFFLTGFLDTPRSLVEKGNELVEEKKYQSAVENYRKAEVARPKEPAIRYNLGTSLYHLLEFRDAGKELDQALTQVKEPQLKAKALYNYGNTQYRLGNFEKAIEAYKKVLDINPKDKDAKYNLEFLQQKKALFEKKNEEKQKQEQKQQPQPQPQQQQKQQEQQQQQQKEEQQQQEQQKQQEKEQQQKEQQRQQQEQQQQEEQQKEQQEPQRPEQGKEQEQETPSQPEPQEGEEEGEAEPKPQPVEKGQEEQREQRGQEEEQDRGEEEKREQQEGPGEEGERQEERPMPLQGQMSEESALRLLNALQEGEKEIQDLRRPQVPPQPREALKDW